MLSLRVKRAYFSLFLLVSTCTNDYFRVYAVIDFLANRLVFLNTITYIMSKVISGLQFAKQTDVLDYLSINK